MSDLIGKSFGRYHILEQLGEGGMATVFKAYDTRLETDVAIKIIRTDNLPQNAVERALKRFEREAKALARLTHPNIVSVTDYGEQDGAPYLVMKYLPGGTLKQKMGKSIPWQEAIHLLLPIAEALDYAHSQNMIHRDVKPANILLTERNQPMLTDFGIAKVLDLEETLDLTGTSAAVGTPEYMAPEQATAKTVDHRADIYALGVVLYEMITGKKPYSADTPMAVLIMHARDPLPNPKKFAPGLPDEVEKVLLKALAKRPEDRYQSMDEMVVGFEKLLGPWKPAGEKARDVQQRQFPKAGIKFSSNRKVAGVLGLTVLILGTVFLGSLRTGKWFSPVPIRAKSATVEVTAMATVEESKPLQTVVTSTLELPPEQNTVSVTNDLELLTTIPSASEYVWGKESEWSSDGNFIAISDWVMVGDSYKISLHVYDVNNKVSKEILNQKTFDSSIIDLAFSPDQDYLAGSFASGNSKGGMVIVWNKDVQGEWKEYTRINLVPPNGSQSVKFFADNATLAYGWSEGVGIWDLQNNKLLASFSGLDRDFVENIFLLENEKYIGYAGYKTVIVRNVADGTVVENLAGDFIGVNEKSSLITMLKRMTDGRMLYTYNISTKEENVLITLPPAPDYTQSFSVSSSGKLFSIFEYAENTIKVYDVSSGDELFSTPGWGSFLPDEASIVVYDADNDRSEIFDIKTGELMWSVSGQLLSVSPDGTFLLTLSTDGLQLWSIPK